MTPGLSRYLAAQEAGDRFVDWCEAEDLDPDAPESLEAYEDALEAAQEDDAERRAEARLDAMEDRW